MRCYKDFVPYGFHVCVRVRICVPVRVRVPVRVPVRVKISSRRYEYSGPAWKLTCRSPRPVRGGAEI
jgi:hypothetical protein